MRAITALLFIIIFGITHCQNNSTNSWTLEQCIDSALLNNYAIRSAKVQSQLIETTINNSKQNYLPTLNGGATHGYNWGQTIDPFTNQFATNKVQYNNFYLNSSLVLFSGLQKQYDNQILSIDYKRQQYNLKIEERNLKKQIASAYLQVLLNKEVLLINEEQLKLTTKLKNRIEILIQTEQEPQNKLLEIIAQEESDKYSILKAKNDCKLTLLLLQQLMNRAYDSTFNIESVSIKENQLSIVNSTNYPELSLTELNKIKQELIIKKNKGSFSPTLSLNGSLGTGYSENNKFLNSTTGELTTTQLNTQLGENFYQSVYLSLTIPIYNNKTIKNKHQTSLIEREQVQLNKEKIILEYKNEMEQLKLAVLNYGAQLISLNYLLSANQNDFKNSQTKYESGNTSFTDLLVIKNKLYKTKSELIQIKYRLFIANYFLKLYLIHQK